MIPLLGMLTLTALGITALLALTALVPPGRAALGRVLDSSPRSPMVFAWFVALVATLGSLYLSEIRQIEPCMLCWYQRIAMYPLVIVLGVALLRRDGEVWKTALPLSLIGACTSAYHIAVQWIPSIEVTQCATSAPCSLRYFVLYGWVTIPAMAGAAFFLISTLMVISALFAGAGREAPVEGSAGSD